MTKINRLTIHGFKSFAYKTEIPFDNKFNCILGPNGSGKSNIGDSLCFVLGRLSAKSMRAEKAANLVFNGGKDKKPATEGTVEMVFDNSQKVFPLDAPEISISRTIEKDSNSTYRINGKKKTRTEILDLLSVAKINPDGYNIVLQGDITHFVDMSPLERRGIIEEISDVSIYEEKKHKALLELQKVEEKLNNAEIILKERKIYLRELQKDRDQALKFKELKDKIDSSKATFLHHQLQERKTIKEKFDQEVGDHEAKKKAVEKKVNLLKEQMAAHRSVVQNLNKEIEQRGEKEQLDVHREIEDLKVNLAKEKTRISTLKDELNKIQLRKDQFAEEIKELESRSSSLGQDQKSLQQTMAHQKKELEGLEGKISQFKKKNNIETSHELEKELEDKDKLIEQKQEQAQQIRVQQQDLLREKDKLEFQLQQLEERFKKVKEVEEANKGQVRLLQQHKTNFKNATLKLNQLLDLESSFSSQLSQARKNVQQLQEKQTQLAAKTSSLQANLEANQALNAILSNKKKFSGIHGTIAELGQVNKKYALALETAAGNRLQHLVVDNDKTAADCIKYLKDQKLGSASFIPLNKIRGQEVSTEDKKLLKAEGVHDFALNLVSYKAAYQKAFNYIFGNTLVVEDIDVARKVGIGRMKMTTLDGNLAESSGVMKGGFINRRGSLGFKEKDSLEELEHLEKEIGEMEAVIANILLKREVNEKEISGLRATRGELEGEMIKLEKSLHLESGDLEATSELKKELQVQLKEVDAKVGQVQKDIGTLNKDLAELKTKKQLLRSKVSELRDPRLLAQMQAFEESRQKAREELVRLEGEVKNVSAQMLQQLAPERQKILDILKQHEKEEAQFQEEVRELGKSVGVHEKELTLKEKASKEFYAQFHQLFAQREKTNGEISKAENDLENLRETMRTHEREINLVSLKNAEVKAKLAGLEEEFGKYQKVELVANKSKEELQQEIHKFEIMLSQMSAVNMKALEIYEQIEKEYNSLVEKKTSLETEKTDVLTMMNEIETKKKGHFMKAFKDVNENFQRIFSSLFKKGKAYLQLDNPEKPFEDGLSVKVKLTGNRFMDLKSLSGGEKTLTALSFIFSIQEMQPASFYILDEIDAALDKQNSETLAKLLRSYSTNAQYIVISHNDSLIAEADTLFGVSMVDGVSKVTSLRI